MKLTKSRIGEHLTLTVGRVEELDQGINLKIGKSKTKLRDNFLWFSAPDLLEWLEHHPRKDDDNAPLWIKFNENKAICYRYAASLLKKLGGRAGIEKRLNPHNFRHGSASFWSDYLTDSQMKYKFGWIQSTRVLDIYIHKDSKNIKNRILKLAGVETKEDDSSPLNRIKMQKCYFCGSENSMGRKICYNCKRILNPDMRKLVQYKKREKIKEKFLKWFDKAIDRGQ